MFNLIYYPLKKKKNLNRKTDSKSVEKSIYCHISKDYSENFFLTSLIRLF